MKFLLDENLSPRLAAWLREQGHQATHVYDEALTGRPDTELAAAATANDWILITKDGDFDNRTDIRVLRLAIGNCSTAELMAWLEPKLQQALERLNAGDYIVRVA